MNRLIAYQQESSSNVAKDSFFENSGVPLIAPAYWLITWTRNVSDPSVTSPALSNIINPITGVTAPTVRFTGAALETSEIYQTVATEVGKLYQVKFMVSNITPLNVNPATFTIGLNNQTVQIVPSIGENIVNFIATQPSSALILEMGALSVQQIYVDSIELIELKQYEIDLFDDEEIVLTKEIDDIKDISSKNSGYSKSFSLPSSKSNNDFFKHFYSLDDSGNWNPYEKAQAILIAEGVEVFNGFLKIDDVLKKDTSSIYNVTLFEQLADLKTNLEGKTFLDIGFSELSHPYTKPIIEASWTQPIEGAIIYPMVNWIGGFDGQWNNIHLNNFSDAFRPWINIKWIWDKIFEESGFTYESTFIETDEFTKLHMDWNFGDTFLMFGGGENDTGKFHVDTDIANLFSGTSIPSYFLTVPFTEIEQTQGVDGFSSDFFNLTSDTYTATADNQSVNVSFSSFIERNDLGLLFEPDVEVMIETNSTVAGSTPTQVFFFSGANQYSGNAVGFLQQADGTQTTFYDYLKLQGSATFTLNVGETIVIKIRRANSADNILHIGWFRARFEVEGGTVYNPATHEDRMKIKQFDFIKALTQMFNFVMIPDKTNSTHLLIEPAVDYYGSGGTKDWTEKIDMSEIKLTPHEVAKQYRFKMQHDDKDFNLVNYKENNVREYGEHIKIHNFDVISEEIEVHENVLFAPTYMAYSNGMVIPQIFGEKDGEYVNISNKPRILYFNGIQNIPNYTSELENGGSFNNTTVGMIQSYNEFFNSSNSVQVDYGQSIEYGQGQVLPYKTLFFQYHQDIVRQLTEKESRILEVKADLTPTDMHEFNFNETIFIENQLYRVNSIEYNTTKGELSTLELIKLGNNSSFESGKGECDLSVNAYGLDGTVFFVDASGNAALPNEACCEQAGLNWMGDSHPWCSWKEISHSHGHGHGNHGNGINHNWHWNGGHSVVIGHKKTNGFGHGTQNSLIVGNKNVAQSNTKNLAIIGELNKLGDSIENTLVVGKNNKVDDYITGTSISRNIKNSVIVGENGFAQAPNSMVLSVGSETIKSQSQVTTVLYKGQTTDDVRTPIFMNGIANSQFFSGTKTVLGIRADVIGVRKDAGSYYGHILRETIDASFSEMGSGLIINDRQNVVSQQKNHTPGWDIEIKANVSTNEVIVEVKGERSATIDWIATLYITQISI